MTKFKYCLNCANKITRKSRKLYICKKCGFHFFNSPKPSVGAILVNSKNEILLFKRSNFPKKGYWGLPGGFVDIGETHEQALTREIREEVGVVIKDFRYLGSYVSQYLFKGVNYTSLDVIFIGSIEDNNLIINKEENYQYKFFSKDNIPFEKIAFKDVKSSLKDYLER